MDPKLRVLYLYGVMELDINNKSLFIEKAQIDASGLKITTRWTIHYSLRTQSAPPKKLSNGDEISFPCNPKCLFLPYMKDNE